MARKQLPKVAVITVCWNALVDLKLTVASVQSQAYDQLSHIVVDGKSTDGTAEYLQSNVALFDAAVSEPDKGIYDAMNKAVTFCADDCWIIFLNAGDCFASSDVLGKLQECFTDDVDFVFGDVAIRGTNGSRKIFRARRDDVTEMPACHQSTLVRAQLLKRNKFDLSYKVGADFDFYLRSITPQQRTVFFDGVISEVAPEGFSAKNEKILQRDYYSTILCNVGAWPARKWIIRRKIRHVVLRLRLFLNQDRGN